MSGSTATFIAIVAVRNEKYLSQNICCHLLSPREHKGNRQIWLTLVSTQFTTLDTLEKTNNLRYNFRAKATIRPSSDD